MAYIGGGEMEGELDVFGIHFGGIIDELGKLQGVGGNGEEGINRIPRYRLYTAGWMERTLTEVE